VDKILQFFFVQRRKDRNRQRRLNFVVIFIGFREIFALKLESCRESHRFLKIFLPSQILRGRCPIISYLR